MTEKILWEYDPKFERTILHKKGSEIKERAIAIIYHNMWRKNLGFCVHAILDRKYSITRYMLDEFFKTEEEAIAWINQKKINC